MHTRTLGRTGWRVSALGCGTAHAFDVPGEEGVRHVHSLMQTALEVGVTHFDSAPMYGHSQVNIGQVLGGAHGVPPLPAAAGGEPMRIYTKVLQRDLAGAKQQIANAFQVIGGRIDLLQVHNLAGWQQVLPYLVELKAEGRIGATGVTHYSFGAFDELETAMRSGQADVVQLPLNLYERKAEQRLLPCARDLGLGVLVMTPLRSLAGAGDLTGRLRNADLAPYAPYGVTDAGSLMLAWLLSKHPEVVPIPATSKPARLRSNAAVGAAPPLPPELIAEVEKLAG